MKLALQPVSIEFANRATRIHLPFGLIGLPRLKQFELQPIEGSFPFQSLCALEDDACSFIVLEPNGFVPNYEIELSDEDAESLQLKCVEDVLVLNVATVHSTQPQYVTVNLAGPIIVNRNTLLGRQIIVSNADEYSTHYPLLDERTRGVN